ncbi:FAD-dependent monooxygenase (plasmid) [Staphylococcus sp. KG4-3]|uniref:Oxidoreductase n=2 Tax=Staphylococcus TaxID=1279 RepID=A0A418ILF7_STAXY|nr:MULTISPECIES: FAD-dependent monooxygenase [Staphylococcus]MDW8563233.1 FAD-dependent monooxygenase [Staphylococcus sp. KG4-3]OEK89333.1 oxidoreductase [Staphylococcus shinii]RIN08845.1 oxidoreductase [Staphylococcus xylosus]
MENKRVLISGASIAGLTSAYWLNNNGFEVTIVEKAKEIRGGGYPIDVRGSAINISKMMGIYDSLKTKSLDNMKIKFLDRKNNLVGQLPDTSMKEHDDIEIPRGYLTNELYKLVKEENINILYGDSIKSVIQNTTFASVEFESGNKEIYDLIIGADGIHSNTRKLTFGHEENYTKYLGYNFTGFSMANNLNMYKEGWIYSENAKTSVMYATKDESFIHAFLVFYEPNELLVNHRDEEKQREIVKEKFKDLEGITPNMLKSLDEEESIFFDTTTQIIMDTWSKNNIVLVGDAAHAPSFLTGQGSSLAMIGSYILANELKINETLDDAFEAYERAMKPFVEANQEVVQEDSFSIVALKDDEEIKKRNAILEQMSKRSDDEHSANDVIDITRVINYPSL